ARAGGPLAQGPVQARRPPGSEQGRDRGRGRLPGEGHGHGRPAARGERRRGDRAGGRRVRPPRANRYRDAWAGGLRADRVGEELRLKYRYLDLRRESMLSNMVLRHEVAQAMRRYLGGLDFLELETPILTLSTPEGARDFLVPSRLQRGSFYALPQSPQLFKQLLMIAGYERYFQIARCFRDEDLRADRQPEFTQLDMEMAFVTEEDVIAASERVLDALFTEVRGRPTPRPFPVLRHAEAMLRYGIDRPDL